MDQYMFLNLKCDNIFLCMHPYTLARMETIRGQALGLCPSVDPTMAGTGLRAIQCGGWSMRSGSKLSGFTSLTEQSQTASCNTFGL